VKAKREKPRLDVLLVERGLFASRELAQRAILAGEVRTTDRVLDKAGSRVDPDLVVEVATRPRYVGRGGLKLEAALGVFGVDPAGRTCLDIGASTGGFTDCLLQHGAIKVYAYDVGHSQLDWKIRSDPRVVVGEGINARHLRRADFPDAISLCVIDVSFISLTKILPAVMDVLAGVTGAEVIALIKPQFESRREDVGKGGIVKDPEIHARAVESIRNFVAGQMPGWRWAGETDSPILGTEGNKEFLCHLVAGASGVGKSDQDATRT
jgi:23S rRNA (cytidine1920-2'-O)/16S rRNA (cytidine1409-2'-O)-methyltransferase